MKSTANIFRSLRPATVELFIQYNTDSCCGHITGGVNVYSHV